MGEWENQKGSSDEWYTPKFIFDALGADFDLDVAAPETGPPHVPCHHFFYSSALQREWSGFVWMNPPFGGRNGIIPWMDKFFDHGNGIALGPDRTSAPWFHDCMMRADGILFLKGKVKFITPDDRKNQHPSNGTVLFASGVKAMHHLRIAQSRGLGFLMIPEFRY